MEVPLVVREHWARVERKQGVLVLAKLDIDLGELGPRDELRGGAVDGFARETNRPVEAALGAEEVTLYMKERV